MTGPPGPRTVLVRVGRLTGWVERFEARHGASERYEDGPRVRLVAADGATAGWDATPAPDVVGLLLVRRGGYAVGLADGDRLVAHKAGTRHVQGRTKAGGWSQQRYARRRAHQADDLAEAAAAHVDRLLPPRTPTCLGGDRPLVEQVLARARTPLVALPRWLDVTGDPRSRSLDDALADVRSVAVVLNHLA